MAETIDRKSIPISLFFKGTGFYGIYGENNEIKFDLLLSESHDFQSDVSAHSIEDGSVISDHIHNVSRSGGITGIISNFSIHTENEEVYNRAQDVFDLLVTLYEEKRPVIMQTILDVYENVVIISMPIARDSDSGDSIVIQVNFQQIKIVKLQEVQLELEVKVNNLKSKRNRKVSKKVNTGRSTTKNIEVPNDAF